MTERDQLKLLGSGFRLVRKVIRETCGEFKICMEYRTRESVAWTMLGRNGYRFSNSHMAEEKFKQVLSDPKTIEIRW